MWCTTGIFKKKCGVNGDPYEGASLTCEDGKAHRQEAPEDCLAARLSGCLAACLVPLESLFKICSTTGLPVSNVRYNWDSLKNTSETSQEAPRPLKSGQNLIGSAPSPEIRTKPHRKRPILLKSGQNLHEK